jgi:hypothetical protein
MSTAKAVIGFNFLTEAQLQELVKSDELVIVADRGECWTPENCRQRLSFIVNKSHRDVDPFTYSREVEFKLREFRTSKESKTLYDMFRRVASRGLLNSGLIPSPLEVDFARAYLEWWVCKNFILKNVKEVYFAYHPHSPFDLCVYYMCRAFDCDVYSMKSFYSNPFYILSKNVLDIDEPDLLLSAVKNQADSDSEKSKQSIRRHLEHARNLILSDAKWGYSKAVESRWHEVSILRAIIPDIKKQLRSFINSLVRKNNKQRQVFSVSHGGAMSLALIKLSDRVKNLTHKAYPASEAVAGEKFALFSLQIQPEATTEVFGGIYIEQLQLLREFRALLPDEIPILVRDHKLFRCAESFGRPEDWGDIVEDLPNTYFIDPDEPNSRFIKNSILVCSPSGTCCIEANVLGIPSVYGGRSEFIQSPLAKHISEFSGEADFEEWLESMAVFSGDKYEECINSIIEMLYPFVRYGSPYKNPVTFFDLDKEEHDTLFLAGMNDL